MSTDRQMKRGKTQSLYKYLPESWIDFSVRGKERKQYIAKVERWNSEKLVGINSKRLIRTVNQEVESFNKQGLYGNPLLPPTIGFTGLFSPLFRSRESTVFILPPRAKSVPAARR